MFYNIIVIQYYISVARSIVKPPSSQRRKQLRAGLPRPALGPTRTAIKKWIEPESEARSLQFSLEAPALALSAVDLTDCARGKWVTVKRRFTRGEALTPKDRLAVAIERKDGSVGSSTVYIDDIAIKAVKT